MDVRGMVPPFVKSGTLFNLLRCRGCHNAAIDPAVAEIAITESLEGMDFEKRLALRLNKPRPLHHELMHLAIAGCPNGCTQPQIKDFAVVGQVVVETAPGCSRCGACVEACPDDCASLDGDGPVIDRNLCLNCWLCLKACPEGALTAAKRGYRILAGGKLGRRPRLASTLRPVASPEEVADSLRECAELFLAKGRLADCLAPQTEEV
ncbi:MAG TPA: 4Fe-4S dicluster domain-containing protein [Spirochaetia bacterium]|nr:4Fe-4S dicluster domain-containing protein [Spirochaetia bacterium]